MRCFYPHVEFRHVVLLSVLACCSAFAQNAPQAPRTAQQEYAVAQFGSGSYLREAVDRGYSNSSYRTGFQERDAGPQLYQLWYLYLTLALVLVAVPVQHYRRRLRLTEGHLGILLEERDRIARECHDTLMAGFAAIAWQLEATSKLFRDDALDSTPAAKSCELARSMVCHSQAEARRILCDLRDTEEVTKLLSEALARTLNADHLQQAVPMTLKVEGEELSLDSDCVHHLVCIGQEAVTNAIRHGDPTHINVHLRYESDALSLSIHDNGGGFHVSDRPAPRNGHFGIRVMEERTDKLGGTFRLQTMIGAGTEVTVRVPFHALRVPGKHPHHLMHWSSV
jgi:signal transduction histidine kinase